MSTNVREWLNNKRKLQIIHFVWLFVLPKNQTWWAEHPSQQEQACFLSFLNGDSFLTVLEAVSYLFAQKSVLFLEGRHCGGGKGGVGERGGGDGGGRWDPIHHCKTCNKCYWTSRSRRDHTRYKLAVIIVEKIHSRWSWKCMRARCTVTSCSPALSAGRNLGQAEPGEANAFLCQRGE